MSGLRLEGVWHAYDGHQVVKDVSLSVKPGELVCLLGPSGCGKSTLLRIAAGLEHLQKGKVIIDGQVVADGMNGNQLPPEKRGVGLMFQDYALFPHMTIQENITFGIREMTAERIDWARTAIERVGMSEFADSYPHTLSGGQQQRIALIRALAPEPRMLLLDEPFSGLDVTRRAQVREQILWLIRETGIATLMVTHDPEEAMFMADRIKVMDGGRIVQSGTPVETYFHPENTFVTSLFGPVNKLNGVVEDGSVTTPIGTLKVPDLADGCAVDILIRPEGLRVLLSSGKQPSGNPAQVVSAHLLGRSSHIRLTATDTDGSEIPLQARIPGVFLPASGTPASVWIDERQAYVFPAS